MGRLWNPMARSDSSCSRFKSTDVYCLFHIGITARIRIMSITIYEPTKVTTAENPAQIETSSSTSINFLRFCFFEGDDLRGRWCAELFFEGISKGRIWSVCDGVKPWQWQNGTWKWNKSYSKKKTWTNQQGSLPSFPAFHIHMFHRSGTSSSSCATFMVVWMKTALKWNGMKLMDIWQ